MNDFSELYRYREIVGDWDHMIDTLNRTLPLCALLNKPRTTREETLTRFAEKGIKATALTWHENALRFDDYFKVGNTFEHTAGLINIQEEAAITAVEILDPQPGERIIDLCAAPGNKSVQIAMAMENLGTVIANDIKPARMRAIRSTIDRLGLINISTLHHDASNLPRDCGQFDRVLADVPCSCEGTSRKNPGVLRNIASQIPRLAGAQRAILKRAFALCKEGGRIVYSTCTYSPEENEGVIADVLEEVGDTVSWLPASIEGFTSSPGLVEWEGRTFGPEFKNAMRVWPHQNDTGGFFVAAFQKNAPSIADEEVHYSPVFEPEPVEQIYEHFAMEFPEQIQFVRANKKAIHAISPGHIGLPSKYESGVGLAYARLGRRYPKLTTGAAMTHGHLAQSRVIDLDRAQTSSFLKRREIQQKIAKGFYIVRHDGFNLGLAYSNGDVLESQFPKSHRIADGVDPFGELI